LIPAAFRYQRANSVEEAVRILAESGGSAKVLAGGHSLIPMMKLRLARPEHLVDIGRIPGLKGIRVEGNELVIGALTTHGEVAASETVKEKLPVLAEAASVIGDLQVRNRGTVGGNLAHADPAADLPAAALALDGSLVAVGPDGTRTINLADFFFGPFITALATDEIVTEVRFPIPEGPWGGAYEKFAHHASGYAVVGVAAAVGLRDGRIAWARVGVTGAGNQPYRASAVENALAGQAPERAVLEEAAARAADDGDIGSDLFASADYRRHLCRVYALRALNRAVAAAQNGRGREG